MASLFSLKVIKRCSKSSVTQQRNGNVSSNTFEQKKKYRETFLKVHPNLHWRLPLYNGHFFSSRRAVHTFKIKGKADRKAKGWGVISKFICPIFRLDKTGLHQGLEKLSPFTDTDSCLNLHLSVTATATTAFLRIPNYQNDLSTTDSFFQRMTKKSGMVTKFDPYGVLLIWLSSIILLR